MRLRRSNRDVAGCAMSTDGLYSDLWLIQPADNTNLLFYSFFFSLFSFFLDHAHSEASRDVCTYARVCNSAKSLPMPLSLFPRQRGILNCSLSM
jgi:hypothetical protein